MGLNKMDKGFQKRTPWIDQELADNRVMDIPVALHPATIIVDENDWTHVFLDIPLQNFEKKCGIGSDLFFGGWLFKAEHRFLCADLVCKLDPTTFVWRVRDGLDTQFKGELAKNKVLSGAFAYVESLKREVKGYQKNVSEFRGLFDRKTLIDTEIRNRMMALERPSFNLFKDKLIWVVLILGIIGIVLVVYWDVIAKAFGV